MTRPSASPWVNTTGGSRVPRRQPVTAVRAARRLDRNAGLAEDPDVAAGRPLRDAEPFGELVGRRAGAALQDLQRAQRPGGGADL
jgi:hypothetical protein